MTTDAGVRLGALLEDLENGRVGLGDAVRKLKALPLHAPAGKGGYQRLAEDANGDSPPPPDHSFHQVSVAYMQGKITRFQYEQLAEAAGEAIKSGHEANAPDSALSGDSGGAGGPASLPGGGGLGVPAGGGPSAG